MYCSTSLHFDVSIIVLTMSPVIDSTITINSLIFLYKNEMQVLKIEDQQSWNVQVIFPYCCPVCPSFLAYLNSIAWTTWAIWAEEI